MMVMATEGKVQEIRMGEGWCDFSRVVGKGLPGKEPKEARKQALRISGGRAYQAEVTRR